MWDYVYHKEYLEFMAMSEGDRMVTFDRMAAAVAMAYGPISWRTLSPYAFNEGAAPYGV